MAEVFWGESLVRDAATGGTGSLTERDGEVFYKISNYHEMAPFLMAIVSGSDHWMYVSSTGGLTCGRRNPSSALFPYCTDDKIHDAWSTTGPYSCLLVSKAGRTSLWKPFFAQVDVYGVERNLYKNLAGNRLIFEEINHSLGLTFSSCWSSSERYGFVRKTVLQNRGDEDVQLAVLDGLRNILPYGVTQSLQSEMSTLLDAYKKTEAVPGYPAALYSLSSIPTDRAEPSEALSTTIAWTVGLESPGLLLSEDQLRAFETGQRLRSESTSNGKRGAFFVHASIELSPGEDSSWYLVSDVNQGPSQVVGLLEQIEQGIDAQLIEADIEQGTQRILQRVGDADGCQLSSDALVAGRHFSNTLFNIMRGGLFYDDYWFPCNDFRQFVATWNRPLLPLFDQLFASCQQNVSRFDVFEAVQRSESADMVRMALEYLPLTFSRRHGDPSRPWNRFSIDIKNPDGSDKLYYEGNWRDIFQNWEALALSYPEFIESFIAKFVNASTADGYNPYRITREGFEWEVLDLEDPWSNIGYWGDHQVNYLVKLLELSRRYHPGMLSGLLTEKIFVYADVPYRIRAYQSLVNDPRNSVDYDRERAEAIEARVKETGSDGRLVVSEDGLIYRVSLLEKLLVPALSKLGNFVPGGGIWMNTQRPEWNDANNALVGYGLSMVTLCYLRRYMVLLQELLGQEEGTEYSLSVEVAVFLAGIQQLLNANASLLGSAVLPGDRKQIMDGLGELSEAYRGSVYRGFSGECSVIDSSHLKSFLELAVAWLDHGLAHSRREDGLYHSYNLIDFGKDGYKVEYLQEMLEGQVAVLSSGFLDPASSLDLLNALRESALYRSDQNSYILYPKNTLQPFIEKNIIDDAAIQDNEWLRSQLGSGNRKIIEQDVSGKIHFNGRFRNAEELRCALKQEPGISREEIQAVISVFEDVFAHRQFTGRSGAMYKYEGLGCIYWHMVSKLLLADAECIEAAVRTGSDQSIIDSLLSHFDEIQAGLGVHKTPADYGAVPLDPYSHTTGFSGVQQPGMTGQVKEDIISRFMQLGVRVEGGVLAFSPFMLDKAEFTRRPETWRHVAGGEELILELEPGSLAFSLCGVPVIYRLADSARIRVFTCDGGSESVKGNSLDKNWSAVLFRRDKRISKLIVDLPESTLRQ